MLVQYIATPGKKKKSEGGHVSGQAEVVQIFPFIQQSKGDTTQEKNVLKNIMTALSENITKYVKIL